ncbi:MAG: hypothetical protein ABIJ74_04190 [archaeon]
MTVQLKTFSHGGKFNYFGYPYTTVKSNFKNFFAPILDKIIFAMDEKGGSYFPGISDSLQELDPGQGYKIQVSEPVEFVYPKLCSDGTVSGYCSGFAFCDEGTFTSTKCDVCGCPTGKTCQKINNLMQCTGEGKILPEKTASNSSISID